MKAVKLERLKMLEIMPGVETPCAKLARSTPTGLRTQTTVSHALQTRPQMEKLEQVKLLPACAVQALQGLTFRNLPDSAQSVVLTVSSQVLGLQHARNVQHMRPPSRQPTPTSVHVLATLDTLAPSQPTHNRAQPAFGTPLKTHEDLKIVPSAPPTPRRLM